MKFKMKRSELGWQQRSLRRSQCIRVKTTPKFHASKRSFNYSYSEATFIRE